MGELLEASGTLGTMILGLAVVASLVALAAGGLAFSKKRRVPLAAMVVLPMFTIVLGAFGAYSAANGTYAELAAAAPNDMAQIAIDGMWNAMAVDTLSRWVAAFVFALSAWACSLGALAAGDDTQSTRAAAIMAVVVTIGGALGLVAFGSAMGVGSDAVTLAGIVAFSGLGVALGSSKRALDEQAMRVAGMRFASAVCMLLAVSYGSKAVMQGSYRSALGPDGVVAQATDLYAAIGTWGEVAAPVMTIGWLAMAIAVGIAFFGVFWELGDVVERYTLLDVFATAALMLTVGVSRVFQNAEVDGLMAIGTHRPATDLFKEFGSSLQAALVTVDGDPVQVDPIPGGFGDVFVYKDEKLTRRYAWNGLGWDADDAGPESTPVNLADVTVSELRPLVVIGGGDEAKYVVELLEKTNAKEALLLLRAAEVKADDVVPDEVAHLQVAFMHVSLSDERDLTTELWHAAGDRNYYNGPIYWYGDTDAEEPAEYAAAVLEDTETTGLNAMIGERTRVKDMAGSCLPFISDLDGDEIAMSERPCRFTLAEFEDLRAEAAENYEAEELLFTSVAVKQVEGEQIPPEVVEERLLAETEAIEFCIQYARDEGEEETVGKMTVEAWIGKKGDVSHFQVHERSRLQTPVVSRCIQQRYRLIEFPWPDSCEDEDADPDNCLEEPELEDGEEPPPKPHYEIAYDFRESPEE